MGSMWVACNEEVRGEGRARVATALRSVQGRENEREHEQVYGEVAVCGGLMSRTSAAATQLSAPRRDDLPQQEPQRGDDQSMFGSIREKQLNATTAIAMLALVFGMTGGAWAAKKYLITSTKQISPSVLKALKVPGKNGANGTPGATGPAGPTGSGGSQGGSGSEGKQGAEGKQGPQGVPGEKGPKGTTGSPWTPNSQLPEGATETGAWSFGPAASAAAVDEPVASFAVKLKAPLDGETCGELTVPASCKVHFINEKGKEEPQPGTEVTSTACLGSAAEPTATSGNLCIYAANMIKAIADSEGILRPENGPGAGVAGAFLFVFPEVGGEGHGTWAVTG